MPYELIEDLPNTVRSHLAERAQEIYLAAFNSAWTNYAGLDVDQLEEIGHRVAWPK
jgi:cation transport regulator